MSSSGRRGEAPTDPRIIANQEKILKYLRSLQDDHHRIKQDLHMLMKENKHFQKDVYENFRIVSGDISTLQESIEDLSSSTDSMKNKTKSIYKHMKSMSSQQNSSDTDSSMHLRKSRGSRAPARANIRLSHGFDDSHTENYSPDSDTDYGQPLRVDLPSRNNRGSYGSDPNLLKPHSRSTTKKTGMKEKVPVTLKAPPTMSPLSNGNGSRSGTTNSSPQYAVASPVQLQDQPPANLPKPDTRRVRKPQKSRENKNEKPKGPLNLDGLAQYKLPEPRLVEANMTQRDCEKLAKLFGLKKHSGLVAVERATQSRGAQRHHVGFHSVYIVDCSTSMEGEPVEVMKRFLSGVLECLDVSADRLALEEFISFLSFGKDTIIFQPFNNNYNNLMGVVKDELGGVRIHGRSPLLQALATALCYIECHADAVWIHDQLILPRIVIMSDFRVTDEKYIEEEYEDDVASKEEVAKVQQLVYKFMAILKRRKYPVHCVPVGDCDRAVAEKIAELGGGHIIEPDDYEEAGNYYRHRVITAACLSEYNQSQDQGVEEDIEELVEKYLPLVELPPEDKEIVLDMITNYLTNDGYPDDELEQDQIENDAEDDVIEPIGSGHKGPVPSSSIASSTQNDSYDNGNHADAMAVGDVDVDLPEWRVPKGTTSLSLQEIGRLPPLGSRVQRGKDWAWGAQDGQGNGTVIGHKTEGIVFVLWDNNRETGAYRFGCQGNQGEAYDIEVIKSPRQVEQGHIEIGCWVVRGRDWEKGDEDGGPGTVGIVIRKLPHRFIQVRWPSRVIDAYKFGADDTWEVQVTCEEPLLAEASDVPVQEEPLGATAGSERPAVQGQEQMEWVWRWQDRSDQWRIMSSGAITKLEQTFSKNTGGNVMIQHKGKNAKVFLASFECEINGVKRPIQREMMNASEVQSLQAVEDMMAD